MVLNKSFQDTNTFIAKNITFPLFVLLAMVLDYNFYSYYSIGTLNPGYTYWLEAICLTALMNIVPFYIYYKVKKLVYCKLKANAFIFSNHYHEELIIFEDINEIKEQNNDQSTTILVFKFNRKTKFGYYVKVIVNTHLGKHKKSTKTANYLQRLIKDKLYNQSGW